MYEPSGEASLQPWTTMKIHIVLETRAQGLEWRTLLGFRFGVWGLGFRVKTTKPKKETLKPKCKHLWKLGNDNMASSV